MASPRRTPASSEGFSLSVALGGDQLQSVLAERLRRDGGEQLADGGLAEHPPDLLGHELEAAVDLDRSLAWAKLAGQDAEKGGLADAVDANQRGVLFVADVEGDAAEQHGAVRADDFEVLNDDRHVDTWPWVEGRVCGPWNATRSGGGRAPHSDQAERV